MPLLLTTHYACNIMAVYNITNDLCFMVSHNRDVAGSTRRGNLDVNACIMILKVVFQQGVVSTINLTRDYTHTRTHARTHARTHGRTDTDTASDTTATTGSLMNWVLVTLRLHNMLAM